MFESTSVTIDTSVKLARASNCVPAPLRVQSSRVVATEGADTLAPTTERLLANRLGHTLEPAFGFEGQVTVWNRRGPGRLTLRGFEPDLYRIKPEWVSLPADGKRSFQGLKTFFEGKHWRVRLYIARPLPLDLGCVCAGEPRHKWKQALPFSLSCAVIQLHCQMADGPREALWHILDPTDGPIIKACGNQRRLIDAGSAIFAREPVGAHLELPVQDVIETVHGGDPYAAAPLQRSCSPDGVRVNTGSEARPRSIMDEKPTTSAARIAARRRVVIREDQRDEDLLRSAM